MIAEDIETNGGGAEGEVKKKNRQVIIKTVLYIAALCCVLVALTFASRFAGLINSLPLKITVLYVIYLAMISLVVIACKIEKNKIADLGFYREKMRFQILIGIGIAVALSFFIGALPILIGGSGASLIGGKQTDVTSIVYSIITDLIFIGTAEELIFRGYIQTRINALTKYKFVGVLIAAALFGIWHIINGTWIQVILTFLIGCVFGFARAYLKNCSLLSVIIAHGLYDVLLVVFTVILM